MSIERLKKIVPRKLDSAPRDLADLAQRTFTFASDVVQVLGPLLLEVDSAQVGPRSMTTAQRERFVPKNGTSALVYDTTLAQLCFYVPGVGWHSVDLTAL